MKQIALYIFCFTVLAVTFPAVGGEVTIPNTFTAGSPARASDVNANFLAIDAAVDGNASDIATNAASIGNNTADIADNLSQIQLITPIRTRLDYLDSITDQTITLSYELLRTIGNVTKQSDATDLIVEWNSHVRVTHATPTSNTFADFQIRLNSLDDKLQNPTGFNSSDGRAVVYMDLGGGTEKNAKVFVKAIFKNLPAGTYPVEIWIRGSAQTATDNFGNFNPTVFIEESLSN